MAGILWKPVSRSPVRLLADYVSPLQPVPKTAVLMPGFREVKRVRVFSEGWDAHTIRFRPEVLAACWQDLIRLAQDWRCEWPMPARAIVVFGIAGRTTPPVDVRDLLWDRFGLPVFEQVLNVDRQLLASECEAHDGLHLRQGVPPPGYALHSNLCACGDATPRLFHIDEPTQELAMASSA